MTAGDLVQFNEIRAGSSYASQNDSRLHFGLGSNLVMNKVEVAWPSGKKDSFTDLHPDFVYTINEDRGIEAKIPFTSGVAKTASPAPARRP